MAPPSSIAGPVRNRDPVKACRPVRERAPVRDGGPSGPYTSRPIIRMSSSALLCEMTPSRSL